MALISRSQGLRYSEAYPGEEIDDDLYNYHLQQLVKNGYLVKVEGKYNLTDEGVRENLLFDSVGIKQDMFRLSVVLVVTRNNKKELLIHERLRQPYRGEVSTISGKVRNGETLAEAARRKLLEEAGLVANFEFYRSWRSIRRTKTGKLIEDTIYCVCVASEPTGKLIEGNEFGKNRWGPYENIFGYLEQNVATGEIEKKIMREIMEGKRNEDEFEEVVELAEDFKNRGGTR